MSQALPERSDDSRNDGRPGMLFSHELRRDGRPVAILRGVEGMNGAVTVETEIYPITAPASSEPQVRPYAFPTLDLARRFVDETLLALEYMGCTLAE